MLDTVRASGSPTVEALPAVAGRAQREIARTRALVTGPTIATASERLI